MKNNFSTPGFLWPVLALVCTIIILTGLYRALQKTKWDTQKKLKIFFGTTAVIITWIVLVTVLAYKNFFADFTKLPPRPGLALLLPLPFVIMIALSRSGTKLLQTAPPSWLVFIQSFRIFVELLIWFAFMSGKLPVQMSVEGRNFDVLTGILALPVGYFLLRKKSYAPKIAIAYNVLGLVLLLNIVVTAFLSMPTSLRYFMNEPSAVLIGSFPFILLPAVLVPIAYSFHIFSLRQLLTKK